jgi:serine/threonine-protein kinase RsbW
MFLPGKRFNPARVRQVCLLLIDTPIFIVTDECDERSYLAYISAGVSRIITPPISFLDFQSVYNGVIRKPNEMIFGKSRELIQEGQVRLDFLIPSKLSRIIGVNRLVSFLTAEFGFPQEDFRVNLPMVMDEALTNAIVHGNRKNPELKVHVRIYISSHRIKIQIEDKGEGFDFNATADPTESEALYNDSGRGIFIIREIMDELSFRNGGRVIEMEKLNGNSSS